MDIIVDNIQWIMLVSGVMTFSMIFAFFAPRAGLNATFGEANAEGAALEIVTRNWGALIALIGAMLIYGAYDPPGRPFILIVAGVSKLVFIGLILTHGTPTARRKAAGAILIDTIMIILFGLYLLGASG